MDLYVTMAVLAGTAVLSFLVTVLVGRKLLPLLHKLKFGQTILDIGPSWHKNKQGTPTMGGLMFIFGTIIVFATALVFCETVLDAGLLSEPLPTTMRLFAGVALALGCGLIGFADDYIKVVKKRNLGLTSRQKLIAQISVGLLYALLLYFAGADTVFVPLIGNVSLGLWFIPLCTVTVIAATNAVNLNDGVDGLCGSVTFVATLALVVAGVMTYAYAQSLLGAALCGALAAFLVYNLHPAKVFMGDTGALFLGGAL